jgi:L-2-hydroxyglutarate oxidase LhgO
VVADIQDAPQLEMLAQRAQQHGISIEELDEQQLREMEPEARSATGRALYVPSTTVGDPAAVMSILREQLASNSVMLTYNARLVTVDAAKRRARPTTGESLQYGHAINTAGLYADKVAHQFGCGKRYTLLPFKGIYWKLNPESGITFNHLVYPVPDLRVPFLGVHTTTTVDGNIYLGPTAVPAFGRENYSGIQGVQPSEAARISTLLAKQYAVNRDGFRRLAWQEGRRYFKCWFAEAAQAIAPNIKPEHLQPTNKVGIRAQMYDRQEGKLVNDFLIEQGAHSTHILNAISPAWTSAFPFARHVCDHYI